MRVLLISGLDPSFKVFICKNYCTRERNIHHDCYRVTPVQSEYALVSNYVFEALGGTEVFAKLESLLNY